MMEASRSPKADRLLPILMTLVAFTLGTLPLVIDTGPGTEMREALGIAVFLAMIGATQFGIRKKTAIQIAVAQNVRSFAFGRSSAIFSCSLFHFLKLFVVNNIHVWQDEAIKLQVCEIEVLLQPSPALHRGQRLAAEKIKMRLAGKHRQRQRDKQV